MKIALICWVGAGALADDLIGEATRKEFEALGHEVDLGPWPKTQKELVARLNACDSIVFGGGSNICPTNMPPMNTVMKWGGKVDRPLHLLGCGFRKETPLLSDEQRSLNQYLFSRVQSSWLRGKVSADELVVNGIHREHDGFGDPGVLFDVGRRTELPGPGPHMTLVVRNLPNEESKNVQNRHVHEFYRRLCLRWHEDTGGSCVFVSWRHKHLNYDNDLEAAHLVKGSLPPAFPAFVHATPADPEGAAAATCSGDVVVSQRLHPTIVALANGCKAVGLDYQFNKMADFASVIDYPYWMHTNRLAQGADAIGQCIDSAMVWGQRGVEYPRLVEAIGDMRTALRNHIAKILPRDK